MANKDKYSPRHQPVIETVPFDTAEEAWFWFIQAQAARSEGARIVAGAGNTPRPCEPSDILNILNRLHRQRRLLMDHLLVLRYYGKRCMPPDPRRAKEMRAHKLWKEALDRLDPHLMRKGIIRAKKLTTHRPNKFWAHGAVVYENLNTSGQGA